MAETIAEETRMALAEVGRPDLAALVGTNKAGHPMRSRQALDRWDASTFARAMALAWREDPAVDHWVDWADQLTRELAPSTHAPHWSPARGEWVDDYDPEDWRV